MATAACFSSFLVALLAVLPASPSLPASVWPRWRGPMENGHTAETGLPVKWTDSDVAWKTPLPGSGQSSPIIWGDRIFLTAALDQGRERIVFAVDRKSGKILWQRSAWKGEPEKVHIMNGWASPSCATDGEIVVAFFGRGGIHAYSVDGTPLWSRDLGKFESPWGVSACPVIVDDLVIQNCDADVDAYITGLNKRTGETVWKTKRRDHRGWSTPIVVAVGDHRELVVNGHEGVQAGGFERPGGGHAAGRRDNGDRGAARFQFFQQHERAGHCGHGTHHLAIQALLAQGGLAAQGVIQT